MTAPDRFDPSTSPLVQVAPRLAAPAGHSVVVDVTVTHRGSTTEPLTLTVLGLDPEWVPGPLTIGPLAPGESTVVRLTLVPARGTLGAEYPFVVAVQAGRSTLPGALGTAESHLVVDALDRLTLSLEPQAVRAVFGRRITVQVGNPGSTPREIELAATAAAGASVSLEQTHLLLQPGQSVTVPGRVKVTRPRVLGHHNVHAFSVTGRGRGAPHHVDGTVRSRPILGGKLTGAISLLLIVAVWVAAAIVLIPRLSQSVSQNAQQQAFASATPSSSSPSSSDPAAAGPDGGAGGEPGVGGGPGGEPGDRPAAGDAAKLPKLAGTIAGPSPEGVTALLEPTTLAQAVADGAMAAPAMTSSAMAGQLRTAGTGPIGKMTSSAMVSAIARDTTVRSTVTDSAGGFEFSDVQTPGLYLLTLTMAGFQTQRFVVDADQLADGAPLEVMMVPGTGRLSGTVGGPDGAVGAATVTITDGTVSLQTSSVSQAEAGTVGDVGSWSVDGLSTPGTYLVTASSPGLGDASALVELGAAGEDSVDFDLAAGQAQVTGVASGRDDLNQLGGLGGLTVVATGASAGTEVERTTTTVTTGPVGTFVLPDLPVPGEYTVTVSGTGYVPVTRTLSLAADSSAARLDFSMIRSTGAVVGTVTGVSETGDIEGGLSGVRLSLTGQDEEFRTTSASDNPGVYRFAGVPPGTYVVSASQFGRRTSAATVTVTAAGTVTADLSLQAAADAELASDARIRGRVVDARTQGPLTCDRAAVRDVVCALTAAVTPDSGPAAGRTLSTGAAPGEEYTLPSLLDTSVSGLVAGVYQVTLSAPGYESTTVPVQVAEGQIAPAPQVALQPLGVVTGVVGTRVGTTSTASCVVVAPAGAAVPTTCRIVEGGCEATGARCTLTGEDGTFRIAGLVHGGYRASVIPRDPEYRPTQPLDIQLELGGDFRYEPVLDRLGRIAVTVMRPDQETLRLTADPTADIEIRPSAGGDLVGLQIGPAGSGGVRTFGQLTGTFTVTSFGETAIGNDTGIDGPITVADNQTQTAIVILTRQIGSVVGHLAVTVDGSTVNVDRATVVVTGVVGFVGTSPDYGSVTVTTDAQGCYAVLPTDPSYAAVPLTTQECPTPVTDPKSIARLGIVALPLTLGISDPVVPPRVEGRTPSAMVIPQAPAQAYRIPSELLQALASDAVGSTRLQVQTPQNSGLDITDLPEPTYTVTRKPGNSGAVTVTAGAVENTTADGVVTRTETLVWRDAAQAGDDQLLPGRYTLAVTRHGFTAASMDLWCGLGAPCVPAAFGADGVRIDSPAPEFVQRSLPSASLSFGPHTLPPPVTYGQATILVTTQPAGSLTTAAPPTSDPPGNTVITLTDANYFGNKLARGRLMTPGRYVLSVSLPGFQPQANLVLNCGADFRDPCRLDGSADQTINLVPLPKVTSTVILAPAPPVPTNVVSTVPQPDRKDIRPEDVSVTLVSQPNPDNPIVAKVDANGGLVWLDPTQPDQIASLNTYRLQFAASGYQTTFGTLTCAAPTATTGPPVCTLVQDPVPTPAPSTNSVRLALLPAFKARVVLNEGFPSGLDWDDVGVAFTLVAPETGSLTQIFSATGTQAAEASLQVRDSTLPWPGVVREGSYTVQLSLQGYGTFTFGPITCSVATPAACNNLTFNLTSLPKFTGRITLGRNPASPPLPNPAPPLGDLTGVTVSVSDQSNPGRRVTVAVKAGEEAGQSAALTWQENGQPEGLVSESTYTVTASKPGYNTTTQSFRCVKGQACAPQLYLEMYPVGAGVVVLSALPPGATLQNVWQDSTVTLVSAPAGTGGLTVTIKPDGTDDDGRPRGRLEWSDASLPAGLTGITRPGNYVLSVGVRGFGSQTSASISCTTGYCSPVIPQLVLMTEFVGKVELSEPPATGSVQSVAVSVVAGAVNGREPTVSVAANGDVIWTEPGQPSRLVSAGTYSLQFSLPGYTTQPVEITCEAGAADCDMGTVTLSRLPQAGGTVTFPAGSTPDWNQVKARLVRAPAGTPVTITVERTSATTGVLKWSSPPLPDGTVQGGLYEVEITAANFPSTSKTFTCPSADCSSGEYAMGQYPVFTGSVVNAPAVSPVQATVTVQVISGRPATITVAANGAMTWKHADLAAGFVVPGSYVLTASAPGYLPLDQVTITCDLTGCTPPVAMVLSKASILQLKTVLDGTTTPINGATFTLDGDGATSTSTLTAPNGSNSVSFPGRDPSENFNAVVGAAGYELVTVTAASTAQVTCVNGSTTRTGLQVIAGGTTECTVRLKKLGTITGTIGANFVATAGTVTSTLRQLGDIPITVQQVVDNAAAANPATRTYTGPEFTTVSSATAPFSVTGTATLPGLVTGLYEIRTSVNGYFPYASTVRVNATHAVVTSGLSDAVTVDAAGRVAALMTVKPVAVRIELTVDGALALPGVTVQMTGDQPSPVSYTCTITTTGTCATGGNGTTNTAAKYVEFTGVTPGGYLVKVLPNGTTYRQIETRAEFLSGVDPAVIRLSTGTTSSTQTGKILLPGGAPARGAAVSLRIANDPATTAFNANGAEMKTTIPADGDGTYTFALVPPGAYVLVAELQGRTPLGQNVTLDTSATGKVPASVTMPNTRATRQASVAVTSTALDPPSLAGTTLTLTSAGAPAGLPADPVQSGLALSAAGAVSISSIGTGNWTAAWQPGSSTDFPFGGTLTNPAVVIATAPYGVAAPGPVDVGLELKVAKAVLQVSWTGATCTDYPQPGGTDTLSLDLTSGGVTKTVTARITTEATRKVATATVFLPPGAYSVQPTASTALTANWNTPAASTFTIDTAITTGAVATVGAMELTPKRVPVTVAATVSGTAASAGGLTVTPSGGTAVTLGATGTAALCLPAGSTTFTLGAGATGLDVKVLPVTQTVAAGGTVTLPLFRVVPRVTEQSAGGRTADASPRAVTVTLAQGAGAGLLETTQTVTLAASASTADGTAVIVGAEALSVKAVPPAGAFGEGTITGVSPSGLAGGVAAVTLPYQLTMLTVNVKGGDPVAAAADASITFTPALTGGPTVTEAGGYLFRDVPPATYDVSATATIDGAEWAGSLTDQTVNGLTATLELPLTEVTP